MYRHRGVVLTDGTAAGQNFLRSLEDAAVASQFSLAGYVAHEIKVELGIDRR